MVNDWTGIHTSADPSGVVWITPSRQRYVPRFRLVMVMPGVVNPASSIIGNAALAGPNS